MVCQLAATCITPGDCWWAVVLWQSNPMLQLVGWIDGSDPGMTLHSHTHMCLPQPARQERAKAIRHAWPGGNWCINYCSYACTSPNKENNEGETQKNRERESRSVACRRPPPSNPHPRPTSSPSNLILVQPHPRPTSSPSNKYGRGVRLSCYRHPGSIHPIHPHPSPSIPIYPCPSFIQPSVGFSIYCCGGPRMSGFVRLLVVVA